MNSSPAKVSLSTPSSSTSEPPIVSAAPVVRQRAWLGNSDGIATVWMVGGLICVTLAALMHVGENRRVYLPGASAPLPELCMLYSRLGFDCPGCGLTRTFIHMAHGQLSSAWQTNPVGMLVFVFACVQIPMGMAQVVFRSATQSLKLGVVGTIGAQRDY